MKRALLVLLATLTLAGCDFPDLDGAAFTPRNSTPPVGPAATTAQAQPAPSKYMVGQPSDSSGDYSNYF